MPSSSKKKEKNRFVIIAIKTLMVLIVIFSLYLMYCAFSPLIYDLFWGKNVVDDHIRSVVGNSTDADQVAYNVLSWEESHFQEPYSAWENKWYNKKGIYKINGSYKLFIRSNRLSWLIKTQLGNCGERAQYFAQMMNNTGTRARMVCVIEDHCWAEYQSDGYWVSVDPSQGTFVVPRTFGENKNWSKIEAISSNGTKEDVTEKYVQVATLDLLSESKGRLKVYSTALSNGGSERYKKPLLVLSKNIENAESFDLGTSPHYNVIFEKNMGLIKFAIKNEDVTLPRTINVSNDSLYQIKNVRANSWTVVLGIVIISIVLFYFIVKYAD